MNSTPTGLEPFDLTRALSGAEVVTRDGRTVQRVVHLPEVRGTSQIVCVINGSTYFHNVAGESNYGCRGESDLFIKPAPPVPREWKVWVKGEVLGTNPSGNPITLEPLGWKNIRVREVLE